jgi:hypothetical protein
MQLTEATTLDRKSGEAEGSAVLGTSRGNVLPESERSREICGFLLRPPGEKLPKFGHYALGTTLAA